MIDKELILAFVGESMEMIEDIEPNLVILGKNAEETGEIDENIINNIFRLFHSLKGGAAALNLKNISSVTHEMETLLDLFRTKKSKLNPKHVSLFCKICDFVRTVLLEVENSLNDNDFKEAASILKKEVISHIKEIKPTKKKNKKTKKNAPKEKELKLEITPTMISNFCQESQEYLDNIEQILLELEEDPNNIEPINEAFRYIHSFKGNCGFFSLDDLEKLSHTTENLFDLIRNKKIPFDNKEVMILLAVIDKLREGIINFSNNGKGEIVGFDQMINFLNETMFNEKEFSDIPLKKEVNIKPIIENNEEKEKKEEEENKNNNADIANNKLQKILKDSKNSSNSFKRKDIRVDINKVDNLIDLIGELVISGSMVTKNPDLEGYNFENFDKSSIHLTKIIRELHDSAMSMRMIPISGMFRKMLRLVYDLSEKCGKKVDLKISGEETEIDRSVIENLSDPLVHIIRNAVDHGIGSPEERKLLNKPEKGTIKLEAKHEGGEVWITISDDGKGLDRNKILKKAKETGLLKEDPDLISDNDVFNMIFLPGFSTAKTVTDVSGRGVGMDVVRQNIEKLKGRIDIVSTIEKGSQFILRFPLTLAIIDGMLVKVGKSSFIVPLLSIKESLQVKADNITKTIDGSELVNIRGNLIPVLRLHQLYKIRSEYNELTDGIIIVVEDNDNTIGLFVDRLMGQQQIVLKALDPYLGNIRGVSGCSILGNGDVSLILDINSLVKACG